MPGIFPEQNFTEEEKTNEEIQVKNTWNFDFATGDFLMKDGKIDVVKKLDALENWIRKVIKTDKNRYKIYTNTKFGLSADLKKIVNSDLNLSLKKMRIEEVLTNALIINKDIIEVKNFKFEQIKRSLKVTFDVKSTFGTIEEEVEV